MANGMITGVMKTLVSSASTDVSREVEASEFTSSKTIKIHHLSPETL